MAADILAAPMRLVALSLFVLTSLGAGCTAGTRSETPPGDDAVGPFADEADYQRQREETAAALEAAIEPAQASAVSACRVVPTSEQACGGPTSFAVYSAEDPDAAEVARLAARLVALDAQANRQFEYVSTCMAYTPPTPALRDGQCVSSRP